MPPLAALRTGPPHYDNDIIKRQNVHKQSREQLGVWVVWLPVMATLRGAQGGVWERMRAPDEGRAQRGRIWRPPRAFALGTAPCCSKSACQYGGLEGTFSWKMCPFLPLAAWKVGLSLPFVPQPMKVEAVQTAQWVERETAEITTDAGRMSSMGSQPHRMKPRLCVRAPKFLQDLVPTSSMLVSSSATCLTGGPTSRGPPSWDALSPLLPALPQLLVLIFTGKASLNQLLSKCGLRTPRGPWNPFRGSLRSKLFSL